VLGSYIFFEKKKQKTFVCLAAASPERLGPGSKVFWFFFSKKNCFLHFEGFSAIREEVTMQRAGEFYQ
jgi:hypothetical protein